MSTVTPYVDFKATYSLEKRKQECADTLKRSRGDYSCIYPNKEYPGIVPMILEKGKTATVNILEQRCLILLGTTGEQAIKSLGTHAIGKCEGSLHLYLKGTELKTDDVFTQKFYDKNKDEDGFLYLQTEVL